MADGVDRLIAAEFVTSDMGPVAVPARMGTPLKDQLMGTRLEQLTELAGRVCYDSLGRGRDSAAFHRHIVEVGHLSVYEHAVFTAVIEPSSDAWLAAGEFDREKLLPLFLNRPGVHVRFVDKRKLHVTLNARSVLEWDRWTSDENYPYQWPCVIRHGLLAALNDVAPQIVEASGLWPAYAGAAQMELTRAKEIPFALPRVRVSRGEGSVPDERWATFLLCGSRGMSHELVRHGDRTAISQRSTRYVDEAESAWVEHPLTRAYLASGDATYSPEADSRVVEVAQEQYRRTVGALESWLNTKGVDRLSARKQARGAAREFLGNALYTEVIFSASFPQWRSMILARASEAADAQIRAVFCEVFRKLSRFDYFSNGLELRPAHDGIGSVVVHR